MKHFFDVGANVGQTFDDYLLKGDGFDGSTIWCFEPSPRHISDLRARCVSLAVSEHNWKINVCGFGLSDRTGYERLFEKQDPRGDSFFPVHYVCNNHIPNGEMPVGVFAPIIDVVHFIFQNVVPPDTVTIKIDVEGSEFRILERILSAPDIWPLIDKILIEWHGIDKANEPHDQAELIKSRLTAAGITVEGWSY